MITQVVGWVESSAPHYAAAFAAGAVIAGLALVGAVTAARWVWQRTREDVLFLAGWTRARGAEAWGRYQWRRSAAAAAFAPIVIVVFANEPPELQHEMAARAVADTFDPAGMLRRSDFPKRAPGEEPFDGLSTADAHHTVDDLIEWVWGQDQPGGAQ